MLKIFFKSAFRNIRKDINQSLLNIAGLALGFAAIIYITVYIFHEKSFDDFHSKSDRIYRTVTKAKLGDTEEILSHSETPLAPAAKKELPEVEEATRLYFRNNVVVKIADDKFIEERLWYADENHFRVFDFPLLEGDKEKVLSQPNSIILTKSFSEKYFGDRNPIGKNIALGDNNDVYQVTGLLADIPANSHLQFNMLASFVTLPISRRNNLSAWGNFVDLYTYILVKENIDIAAFKQKFSEFPIKYYIPMLKEIGISYEDFKKQGNYVMHNLQSLKDIYMGDIFTDDVIVHGSKALLFALGIIGLFIMVIVCFNFINLTTARASLRAKEVGVKKIVGSTKRGLITQILSETFIQCCFALITSICFLLLCLSFLNSYTTAKIEINYLFTTKLLLTMFSIPVIITLLAGIYPSFYITKYKPIEVLKGDKLNWNSKSGLRNVLVAFQFVVFIVLICGTILVQKQILFFHSQNPGFYKENVLVVKNMFKMGNNRLVYKNELLKNPKIISASYASGLPSKFDGASNPFGKPGSDKQVFIDRVYVDHDFEKTMKIEMIDGRFFSDRINEEQNNAILNEKAAKLMGWSDSQDKIIFDYNNGGNNFNVIGIVKDFHIYSLKDAAVPMIIRITSQSDYLALRIQPESAADVIKLAQGQWESLNKNAPFEYFFLDKSFNSQYKSEEQLGKFISLFSTLSIVIACLGLLGLVSFTTNRKRKEIGVRKVNGAKVHEILAMLNADLVKWVIIAFIIACPTAWFIMTKWLENFAYKTEINWWIFALAGVIALVIALVTVSWQSWRAASRNPVEALRYE